jgi:hypothetical protein
MAQRKKADPKTSNPFPYRKSKLRIPREISSAATLWLDFFQQAFDLTVPDSPGLTGDKIAVGRARILADSALEMFQDRFPGVHP